ncbi:hypothetical protein HPK19_14620 [Arthrobacter citreus]|nr:hypothetical protein HPK19_14620 [Arthrobacter citreus]
MAIEKESHLLHAHNSYIVHPGQGYHIQVKQDVNLEYIICKFDILVD